MQLKAGDKIKLEGLLVRFTDSGGLECELVIDGYMRKIYMPIEAVKFCSRPVRIKEIGKQQLADILHQYDFSQNSSIDKIWDNIP